VREGGDADDRPNVMLCNWKVIAVILVVENEEYCYCNCNCKA